MQGPLHCYLSDNQALYPVDTADRAACQVTVGTVASPSVGPLAASALCQLEGFLLDQSEQGHAASSSSPAAAGEHSTQPHSRTLSLDAACDQAIQAVAEDGSMPDHGTGTAEACLQPSCCMKEVGSQHLTTAWQQGYHNRLQHAVHSNQTVQHHAADSLPASTADTFSPTAAASGQQGSSDGINEGPSSSLSGGVTPVEHVHLLWSHAKSYSRHCDQHPGAAWLDNWCSVAFDTLHHLQSRTLTMVAWSLQALNYQPSAAFMEAFSDQCRLQATTFTPHATSLLLHAFLRLQYRPNGETLAELLTGVQPQLQKATGATLSLLLGCLVQLTYHPSQAWLCSWWDATAAQLAGCTADVLCGILESVTVLHCTPSKQWQRSFCLAVAAQITTFSPSQFTSLVHNLTLSRMQYAAELAVLLREYLAAKVDQFTARQLASSLVSVHSIHHAIPVGFARAAAARLVQTGEALPSSLLINVLSVLSEAGPQLKAAASPTNNSFTCTGSIGVQTSAKVTSNSTICSDSSGGAGELCGSFTSTTHSSTVKHVLCTESPDTISSSDSQYSQTQQYQALTDAGTAALSAPIMQLLLHAVQQVELAVSGAVSRRGTLGSRGHDVTHGHLYNNIDSRSAGTCMEQGATDQGTMPMPASQHVLPPQSAAVMGPHSSAASDASSLSSRSNITAHHIHMCTVLLHCAAVLKVPLSHSTAKRIWRLSYSLSFPCSLSELVVLMRGWQQLGVSGKRDALRRLGREPLTTLTNADLSAAIHCLKSFPLQRAVVVALAQQLQARLEGCINDVSQGGSGTSCQGLATHPSGFKTLSTVEGFTPGQLQQICVSLPYLLRAWPIKLAVDVLRACLGVVDELDGAQLWQLRSSLQLLAARWQSLVLTLPESSNSSDAVDSDAMVSAPASSTCNSIELSAPTCSDPSTTNSSTQSIIVDRSTNSSSSGSGRVSSRLLQSTLLQKPMWPPWTPPPPPENDGGLQYSALEAAATLQQLQQDVGDRLNQLTPQQRPAEASATPVINSNTSYTTDTQQLRGVSGMQSSTSKYNAIYSRHHRGGAASSVALAQHVYLRHLQHAQALLSDCSPSTLSSMCQGLIHLLSIARFRRALVRNSAPSRRLLQQLQAAVWAEKGSLTPVQMAVVLRAMIKLQASPKSQFVKDFAAQTADSFLALSGCQLAAAFGQLVALQLPGRSKVWDELLLRVLICKVKTLTPEDQAKCLYPMAKLGFKPAAAALDCVLQQLIKHHAAALSPRSLLQLTECMADFGVQPSFDDLLPLLLCHTTAMSSYNVGELLILGRSVLRLGVFPRMRGSLWMRAWLGTLRKRVLTQATTAQVRYCALPNHRASLPAAGDVGDALPASALPCILNAVYLLITVD